MFKLVKTAQALKNVTGAAKASTYFGRVGEDLKGFGSAINNTISSAVGTGNKAVRGWGRLFDPTSSATLGDRASWLGQGLKSVATDAIPGAAQGVLNLPTNIARGATGLFTQALHTATGQNYKEPKKMIDGFVNKVTDPFQVNFAGNRTGVAKESFNVGQVTGETAASLGSSAAFNTGKSLLAKGLEYGLPRVPKNISSAYAKGITKLTGDKYPITGPERQVYSELKNDNTTIMRGHSPATVLNRSFASKDGGLPSRNYAENRVFLNNPANIPASNLKLRGSFHENVLDPNLTALNNPFKTKTGKPTNSNANAVFEEAVPTPKNSAIFIDKQNKLERTIPSFIETDPGIAYFRRNGAYGKKVGNTYEYEAIRRKDNPVATLFHEKGHLDNKLIDAKNDIATIRKIPKGELTFEQNRKMLQHEASANFNALTDLKSKSKWYNPTNWLRAERYQYKPSSLAFSTYRKYHSNAGFTNKDMFGRDLPNYSANGLKNTAKITPMTTYNQQ